MSVTVQEAQWDTAFLLHVFHELAKNRRAIPKSACAVRGLAGRGECFGKFGGVRPTGVGCVKPRFAAQTHRTADERSHLSERHAASGVRPVWIGAVRRRTKRA